MTEMSVEAGTVYWFTGLTGVGKTTLSRIFCKTLRETERPVVLLDGDTLRGELYDGFGYSLDQRKKLAFRYGRLCRLLANQGVDVVCATISLFHDVQRWNRANITNYREIYITAPIEVLVERDHKGIYKAALAGERSDVMGVNLAVEAPETPELLIDNDGTRTPEQLLAVLEDSLLAAAPSLRSGAAS